MTPFELAQPELDAQVGNHLGDSISYAVNGAAACTLKGFLFLITDDGLSGGIDAIPKRWKCKIDKSELADKPRAADRITAARLGAVTYRPTVETLTDSGNAYIFDLQKVQTA